LTTKIHALVDALGNPANLMLTAGQIHDLACAQDLIENADPEALIADKAYDADRLIDRDPISLVMAMTVIEGSDAHCLACRAAEAQVSALNCAFEAVQGQRQPFQNLRPGVRGVRFQGRGVALDRSLVA
jgi:transposase